MQIWSRRRVETIVLAILGMGAVMPFRFHSESRAWFLSEIASVCFLFLLAIVLQTWVRTARNSRLMLHAAMGGLCVTPILFGVMARASGAPIPYEMTALTTFGAASIGMGLADSSRRLWSLSLVVSGFLVLFCAAISDSQKAISLPLVWVLLCVWHLVANRWERLDLAMPESVERNWSLRPRIVVVALIVLTAGAYVMQTQSPSSRRLELGLMPTSGGTEWSDPAARSGVGTGDEAIAAKDHAESFGAVDSDIFLESNESTLFDMFNDSLGPPKKKKNVWERRQGMNNDNVIPMHEKAARSDQGAGSFSTERLPAEKHTNANDALSHDVLQWDGPTGIRLAMHRYDSFDGRDWTQTANLAHPTLSRINIGEDAWFFDPDARASFLRNPDQVSVGLVKVLGLDSQRIPVPMLSAGIHIKAIDRQDFFAICEDGCLFMPGREKVPPLTIVHVAHSHLTEDEIREHLEVNAAERQLAAGVTELEETAGALIDELVRSAKAEHGNPLDQLSSCVEVLRSEFTFERGGRESAHSLSDFLRDRRGGDHLFATTAAVIAKRLGLQSRLVTGFYVRPDSYEITAGHACVLPEDVHVWCEVQLSDGRWFEVEATPGYLKPHYQPSWGLQARQFVIAHWPSISVTLVCLIGFYCARRMFMDFLLSLVWYFSAWLRPRQRIRLAFKIIETRAWLAGFARPTGKSQRVWLEELVRPDLQIADAVQRFVDSADSLFFGQSQEVAHQDTLQLVRQLRIRTIMSFNRNTKP